MHKAILRLAIPNILTNLTIPLLGAVDTALMGHLPNTAYLAALGVGVSIFNFVYWGFGFLRMSTTGFAAQAYGQNDRKAAGLILYRGLLVAAVLGVLLILFQEGLWALGSWVIEPSPEVASIAAKYFYIRIWAAPANLMLMVLLGWLLGAQNAVYPLIIALVGNAINIALSLYFVQVLDYTIEGVAVGTVIAQYVALFLALLFVFIRYAAYCQWPGWKHLWQRQSLQSFVSVNRDIFLRTLCLMFVFTFITAQSARMGTTILALNTVLLQLVSIISYGIDGFAFAAESLTGKYIVQQAVRPFRKMLRYLFGWGFGIAALLSLAFLLFREPLLRIFTNDTAILSLSAVYAGWIILAPLVNNFAYLWDGIYIGATASVPMRNSMFIATVGVFVPIYYLAYASSGNHALWLAFTLFMIARGALLWAWADRSLVQRIKGGVH